MNELVKRVAYLKGLADGFQIDKDRGEGKLLMEIIETLDGFADALLAVQETQEEMSDYLEDMDESVSGMEELLFGDEEDDDDEEDEEEDDGLIEYDCPHCDTTIFFDENTFSMEDKHVCPNCKKPIFCDAEEEDGDDPDDKE